MATPSSSSASSVRSWRTAFLTLRDESISSSTSISQLLYDTIFSHSDSLIAAARYLPPPEVSSDLLFLLEVTTSASDSVQDIVLIFTDIIHLIHGISYQVALEFSSSSWNLLLQYFGDVIRILLGKLNTPGNYALIRPVLESLEFVRHVVCLQQRKFLPAEDIQLSKFLLSVIAGSQSAIFPSSNSIIRHGCTAEVVKSTQM